MSTDDDDSLIVWECAGCGTLFDETPSDNFGTEFWCFPCAASRDKCERCGHIGALTYGQCQRCWNTWGNDPDTSLNPDMDQEKT